jgi:hypothetical protein
LGDLRIAGDGVDADHGAFQAAAGGEFLEQHRDGGRFAGFVVDGLLPENQTAVGGEGGDQMQRGPSPGSVVAASHGLAVNGDRLERLGPAGADPVHEAGGEQVRVDPVHHDVEPAPGRDPPVERQEPSQELEMAVSPVGDGLEAVALGDRRADAHQQHLVQLVRQAFRTSLVLDPGKMLQQKPQSGGSCGFIRQGVHGAGSESEAPIDSPLPQFVNAVNPSSEPWTFPR